MSNINLLPWRQQLRDKKKKSFYQFMAISATIGLCLAFLVYMALEFKISGQQSRNEELRSEIRQVDAQIAEIAKLKERKVELLARMKAIADLQMNRNIAVRLFSDLPTLVASGVYLDSLSYDQRTASVKGLAESNPRVSSMLRNIDNSKWLGNSSIKQTQAEIQNGQRKIPTLPDGLYNFDVNFNVVDATDPLNANNGGNK